MACHIKETLKIFVALYETTCYQEESVKQNQLGGDEGQHEVVRKRNFESKQEVYRDLS